jgi:hypothetical protein
LKSLPLSQTGLHTVERRRELPKVVVLNHRQALAVIAPCNPLSPLPSTAPTRRLTRPVCGSTHFRDRHLRHGDLEKHLRASRESVVSNVVYFETAFNSVRACSIWSYA